MQRETSNDSFLDYGSVYHQPIDREHPELIHQTMVAIARTMAAEFAKVPAFRCEAVSSRVFRADSCATPFRPILPR